jgi:hypothetical protein
MSKLLLSILFCARALCAQVETGGFKAAPGAVYDFSNIFTGNSVMFVDASGILTQDNANFAYSSMGIANPSAPTVTQNGTAGATSYTYAVVANNQIGATKLGSPTTTGTGNATLDGTNWNNIATVLESGSTSCDIYRTASGGIPSSIGKIGSVACGLTLEDQGLSGDNDTVGPSFNRTAGEQVQNLNVPGMLAVGNVTCCAMVNGAGQDIGTTANILFEGDGTLPGPALEVIAQLDLGSNFGSVLSSASDLIEYVTGTFSYAGASALASTIQVDTTGTTSELTGVFASANVNFSTGNTVAGQTAGVYGQTQGYGGSITNANGIWGWVGLYGATYTNVQTFYAQAPSGGDPGGSNSNVAYFNENMTGIGGPGVDFAWYSEGGTNHLETGAPAYVGVEIERFAGQTADLLQFLDSDGSTVLTAFDDNGNLFITAQEATSGLAVVCVNTSGQLVKGSIATCTGS